MISRSSDLVRLTLIAKLSSTKKTAILAARSAGARLQAQQLVHNALVSAEADGIAEEASDGAEFASIGTAAAGFNGNNVKGFPTGT